MLPALSPEEQYEELLRRFQVMEAERKATYDAAQHAIRYNKSLLKQLKEENQQIRNQLKEMKKNKILTEPEHMQRKMEEVSRQRLLLDQMKNTNVRHKQTLVQLQDKLKELELAAERPSTDASPELRHIRIIENRLDQATIKYNEALSIRATFEQILKRLKEERLGLDQHLAALEKVIKEKDREYEELLSLSHDATDASELAQAELHRMMQTIEKERASREAEVQEKRALVQACVSAKQKSADQDAPLKEEREDEARQEGAKAQEPNQSGAEGTEEPTLEDYENVFRRIKEATGVSDVNEVIQKYLMQGETRDNLVALAKEHQEKIRALQEKRQRTQAKLDEMKLSLVTNHSKWPVVDDLEMSAAQANGRHERARLKYERSCQLLVDLHAGLDHIYETLMAVAPGQVQGCLTEPLPVQPSVEQMIQACQCKLNFLLPQTAAGLEEMEQKQEEEQNLATGSPLGLQQPDMSVPVDAQAAAAEESTQGVVEEEDRADVKEENGTNRRHYSDVGMSQEEPLAEHLKRDRVSTGAGGTADPVPASLREEEEEGAASPTGLVEATTSGAGDPAREYNEQKAEEAQRKTGEDSADEWMKEENTIERERILQDPTSVHRREDDSAVSAESSDSVSSRTEENVPGDPQFKNFLHAPSGQNSGATGGSSTVLIHCSSMASPQSNDERTNSVYVPNPLPKNLESSEPADKSSPPPALRETAHASDCQDPQVRVEPLEAQPSTPRKESDLPRDWESHVTRTPLDHDASGSNERDSPPSGAEQALQCSLGPDALESNNNEHAAGRLTGSDKDTEETKINCYPGNQLRRSSGSLHSAAPSPNDTFLQHTVQCDDRQPVEEDKQQQGQHQELTVPGERHQHDQEEHGTQEPEAQQQQEPEEETKGQDQQKEQADIHTDSSAGEACRQLVANRTASRSEPQQTQEGVSLLPAVPTTHHVESGPAPQEEVHRAFQATASPPAVETEEQSEGVLPGDGEQDGGGSSVIDTAQTVVQNDSYKEEETVARKELGHSCEEANSAGKEDEASQGQLSNDLAVQGQASGREEPAAEESAEQCSKVDGEDEAMENNGEAEVTEQPFRSDSVNFTKDGDATAVQACDDGAMSSRQDGALLSFSSAQPRDNGQEDVKEPRGTNDLLLEAPSSREETPNETHGDSIASVPAATDAGENTTGDGQEETDTGAPSAGADGQEAAGVASAGCLREQATAEGRECTTDSAAGTEQGEETLERIQEGAKDTTIAERIGSEDTRSAALVQEDVKEEAAAEIENTAVNTERDNVSPGQ